jgi:hypothetical protein
MLSLSKIEQWHDSRLLVLRRVAGEDLLNERLILCSELEWYGWVVVGRIAMLDGVSVVQSLECEAVVWKTKYIPP